MGTLAKRYSRHTARRSSALARAREYEIQSCRSAQNPSACITDTEYIWFDLLCIPQDPRIPGKPQEQGLKDIAEHEIGRQAQIFRRAKVTIAWFNDIESWDGMRAGIHAIGLHLQNSEMLNDLVQYLHGIEHLANPLGSVNHVVQTETEMPTEEESTPSSGETVLEIFERVLNNLKDDWTGVNPWFSSLWTLQEICVCPQMRMCTRGWEMLQLGANDSKLPIGFDDLIALDEAYFHLKITEKREAFEQKLQVTLAASCAARVWPFCWTRTNAPFWHSESEILSGQPCRGNHVSHWRY